MAKNIFNFWKKRSATGSSLVSFMLAADDASMCVAGYTRLSDNPEVQMAINYIAGLISSMTIYLMKNTPNGDIRVKDALAHKIDINPNSLLTRKTWMFNLVRNMLLEGNEVELPRTTGGILTEIVPLPPSKISFAQRGAGYVILYNGQEIAPSDALHFQVNPDPNKPWQGMGFRVALSDVTKNLHQASETTKGFMESKWKPSVIIKVDGLTEEFSSKEGRAKLLEQYVSTAKAGEPWLIPADQFSVEQIKPLSLKDLAISDMVTLDKKTVARIIGVPPFVVGAGEFNIDEHRNFINTTLMHYAQIVEQELTKKLLISPERYFVLSNRALYSYDMNDLATISTTLFDKGIMTGNEARGWLNMPPIKGLNDLRILENYIPLEKIGKQKKLVQDEPVEEPPNANAGAETGEELEEEDVNE